MSEENKVVIALALAVIVGFILGSFSVTIDCSLPVGI
jgi:hypothetical protein